MQDVELVMRNGKPLSLVTLSGVQRWQDDGIPYQTHYDLIEKLPDGRSTYRCRYKLPNKPVTYVLVDVEGDRKDTEVRVIHGQNGVHTHHNLWGDGRELVFSKTDTISLT